MASNCLHTISCLDIVVLTHLERRSRVITTGFTLIELIVVIAIIALLIGILMPALSNAKKKAQQLRCANSLRQLGIGVWAYSTDQRDMMPEYYGDPALTFDTLPMRLPDGRAVNLGLIMGYVTDPRLFYCDTAGEMLSHDLAFDTQENPWNNGIGQTGSWLSSGYTARYEKKSASKKNRRVDLYTNQVIFTEFYGVDGWDGGGRFNEPIYAPHEGRGYNLLFGDGGVHWVQVVAINSLRPIGKNSPSPDEMDTYYQLLDVLPAGGGGQLIPDDDDDD